MALSSLPIIALPVEIVRQGGAGRVLENDVESLVRLDFRVAEDRHADGSGSLAGANVSVPQADSKSTPSWRLARQVK